MLAAVIDWSSPTSTRRRRPVTVARYGPRRLASEERHFVSPIPASGEPGVASDRVNPSSVRRRHRWIPGHYSLGGLAFALAFLWFSMTPTLLPRGPVFQALISALSAAFGYAIGVLASRTFRYVVRREPPPAVKRVAWRGLPVVAVSALRRCSCGSSCGSTACGCSWTPLSCLCSTASSSSCSPSYCSGSSSACPGCGYVRSDGSNPSLTSNTGQRSTS